MNTQGQEVGFVSEIPVEFLKSNTATRYTQKLSENAKICSLKGLFDNASTFPKKPNLHYKVANKDNIIKITKSMLDKIDDDADNKIKIHSTLVLKVPLAFDVDNTLSDGSKLKEFIAEKDIFGRKSKDEKENKSLYESLDFTENLSLNIKYDNTLIKSDSDGSIIAKITEASTGFEKILTLKHGSGKNANISLNKSEIEKMKSHHPFKPKIEIFLAKGAHKLNQNGKLKMTLYLLSQMNIDKDLK